MKAIKNILEETPTPYTGSTATFEAVADQIESRFGSKARDEYDPLHNCRTFAGWLKVNRCVKKNSKSLKSIALVEQKDDTGKIVKKWLKKINLFYISQTEPIKAKV